LKVVSGEKQIVRQCT